MSIVDKTPLLTTVLLEGANVGHIHRMWHEHTAAGQALGSWLLVSAALILWFNFFLRTMPNGAAKKWALIGSGIGIVMNLSVILTVTYFKYLV